MGSDSEIKFMWVKHDRLKVCVFQSNREINARIKLSLDKLFNVQGSEMPADMGTRPANITPESFCPNSTWLNGRQWMKQSTEEALKDSVLKEISDVKVTERQG